MDRILNKSRTSIEADFQESVDMETYLEYIVMVNQNLETMSKSLQVAEGLIEQYKLQNEQLKKKNNQLQARLEDLNEQIEYLKEVLMREQGNKIENKILNIARKNENVQKRMNDLVEELEKSQAKVAKLTKIKQEKIERNMHNYFDFGKPEPRNTLRETELAREIRSLKWKLQQKEEEIIYMIKRNKLLEDKGGHSHLRKMKDEDRFYTCETEINRGHS